MRLRIKPVTFAKRKFIADAALALASFAIPFYFYLVTLAPGVLEGDEGEFQTNVFRLGVSHTGYPLFFILTKLWTVLVPFGNVAYRANLFSAFVGALTIALLYVTMRVLVASRGASFFTALLFGLSRVEWSQAVIPRVYTLNSLFIVLFILLAVLWRTQRISVGWLVFAFGLSLTNHRTIAFCAPALALFMWRGEGRALFRPRRLLTLSALFVIPLLLYSYVPLRGDSDVGVEYHAANFQEMILAGNASIWMRYGPPSFLWSRVADFYLPLQLEQFSPVGFAFAWLGLGALAWNRVPRAYPSSLAPWQWLELLALAFIGQTAFAVVFVTADSEKYFIPSYLLFLFFTGIGLAFAFDFFAHLKFHSAALILSLVLVLALTVTLVTLERANFPQVNRSNDDDAQTRWAEILAQPLEAKAVLAGSWESITPYEYFRYVEARRLGLERVKLVIFSDQLKLVGDSQTHALAELSRDVANGRAVYLTVNPFATETLGEWAKNYRWMPMGSLWRVFPLNTVIVPPMQNELPCAQFGDAIHLRGFEIDRPTVRAGENVQITLYWLADATPDASYKVFVHLLDANSQIRAQHDSLPRNNTTPTTQWIPNVYIADAHALTIPADAFAGNYQIEVGLYHGEDGKRMLVNDCRDSTTSDHLILDQGIRVMQ